MKVGKVGKYTLDKKQSRLVITTSQLYALVLVPFLLIPVAIVWGLGPYGNGKLSHVWFWPLLFFFGLFPLVCLLAAFVRNKYVITSDKVLWRDTKNKVYSVAVADLSQWTADLNFTTKGELGHDEVYSATLVTKSGKSLPFSFRFSGKEKCRRFIELVEKHSGLNLPVNK